jgi:DNA-binding transcriptional ArsR family regulator
LPKSSAAKQLRQNAEVFAALGDETRLRLVRKLCEHSPRSISELADGTTVTRQAITKHLRVLEDVGLVKNVHQGRLSLFTLETAPLAEAQTYLEAVAKQWDHMLGRLQAFVED